MYHSMRKDEMLHSLQQQMKASEDVRKRLHNQVMHLTNLKNKSKYTRYSRLFPQEQVTMMHLKNNVNWLG